MKETPKTQQQVLLVKKKTEEKLQEKKCKITLESFFFRSKFLFREKHTTEEENFVIKERSLFKQTNNTSKEDGQKREENKTRENHGLLSLLLFAFGAFLFEGVKVVRWKKKEEEQKKHQSSSVDKDFSGCIIIRAFKQHERGGRFRGRVFR